MLEVSASGHYAWRERAPSARVLANAVLTERIRQVHADSHHSHGMPRVRAELVEQGLVVSRKRVARLPARHPRHQPAPGPHRHDAARQGPAACA